VWLAMGNSFIKLPKDKAHKMLKKDQVTFFSVTFTCSVVAFNPCEVFLHENEALQKLMSSVMKY
jgi:hypothetical protein